MSLPSIFDYLPEEGPGLVKSAMNAGLLTKLKTVAKSEPKIKLKGGGKGQFNADTFNSEAASVRPLVRPLEVASDPFKKTGEQKKEPPTPFSGATVRSAIKTTLPYVVGVPLGAALGKGLGKGLELLEREHGVPITGMVTKYGPMAFMALGGLLAAREAAHRKSEREIWRSAHESAQNGTAGRATE
jgi:hypothetical protein